MCFLRFYVDVLKMLTCIDFLCARQVSKSNCVSPVHVKDGLLLPVVVRQELGLDSEGPHHPAVQVHHLPHRLFVLKIIHLIVIRIEEGKIRKKIQRSSPKIKIKCCPPKKLRRPLPFLQSFPFSMVIRYESLVFNLLWKKIIVNNKRRNLLCFLKHFFRIQLFTHF